MNAAKELGYTRHIIACGGCYELDLLVCPDADLSGSFKAYDIDCCEWIRVSGWNFLCEDY